MISRRLLRFLVVAAILFPITICVVMGTGQLLAALLDDWGAAALGRISLALGIVWVLNLLALVLVLGIEQATGPDELDPP